ncbi:GLPGLI family protein [Paracnuella aquatica]|uniref:GLPGLI family protein n=1 Tax=Paracnuella aquatica TaxID=2268757 RepID=UPI000DEFC8EC|nr:GLPGLI family protein [Paracnuella aquatica]RPD43428.1 GLPGLI family protein [Paracnuella aquatica]
MKTSICLVLIMLQMIYPKLSYCQHKDVYDYQAMYEMKYQPDSTDISSIKFEKMILLFSENSSSFLSYPQYLYDSAAYAETQKGNSFGPSFAFASSVYTPITYHIFKSQKSIQTFDKTQTTNSPYFEYEENTDIFKWILKDELDTIMSFACQKAEVNFGGRKWTAWFTNEIPISTGPYKFSGLPGLIVKISDSQGYWNFSLTDLVNFKTKTYPFYKQVPTKTTKQQFFKLLRESYDNAFILDQQNGITYLTGVEEFKARAEKRAKAANNWIEIYHAEKK